jgi:hypothetical protein
LPAGHLTRQLSGAGGPRCRCVRARIHLPDCVSLDAEEFKLVESIVAVD